uniref:Uncharacterized protein n=1 Tax=Oryza punctata TaxID=4537 RepID=A0A0E0M689_ORYPU
MAEEATDGWMAQDLQLLTPWHYQALVTTNLLLQAISLVSANPEQLNSAVAKRHGDLFQLQIYASLIAGDEPIVRPSGQCGPGSMA